MSLRDKFKKSIESSLREYEHNEGRISDEDSLTITHIRELLKSNGKLHVLRDNVADYVNTLAGHFFSFLPFVNDIKKLLLKILNTSEFLPIRCMWEDFTILEEMVRINQNQSNSHAPSENFISREEYGRDLNRIEARLNSEIAHYKGENNELRHQLAESETENKILSEENDFLKNQIAEIKKQLLTNVTVANGNNDSSHYQNIIKQQKIEIVELKAEINRLKARLNNTLPVYEDATIPNNINKHQRRNSMVLFA